MVDLRVSHYRDRTAIQAVSARALKWLNQNVQGPPGYEGSGVYKTSADFLTEAWQEIEVELKKKGFIIEGL